MGEKMEREIKSREKMIRNLIDILKDRGYEALRVGELAEFNGRRPAAIHWENSDVRFAPDIMARRKGREYIFQVESTETLQHPQEREKTALFSRFAEHFRQQFCIVVPAACRDDVMKRLADLRIDERYTYLITYEHAV